MNRKPVSKGKYITRNGVVRTVTSYTKTWKRCPRSGKVIMK
jgi:hypothetical protein